MTINEYTNRKDWVCWCRVLVCLFAMVSLATSAGIPIERAQRDLQARYYFLKYVYSQFCSLPPTTTNYLVWPDCRCSPAPPFPPDGFYSSIIDDPKQAAGLVRNLLTNFYNVGFNTYNFVKTTNGVDGIEGSTEYWPDANYYTPEDFPWIDHNSITITNYTTNFNVVRLWLDKLRMVDARLSTPELGSLCWPYIVLDENADPFYPNRRLAYGYGDTLAEAKAVTSDEWATNSTWFPARDICLFVREGMYGMSGPNGTGYAGVLEAQSGKLRTVVGTGPATVLIYMRIKQLGDAVSNNPPIQGVNTNWTWRLFKRQLVGEGGGVFHSDTLAGDQPVFTDLNPQSYYQERGWIADNYAALLMPDFGALAEKFMGDEQCGSDCGQNCAPAKMEAKVTPYGAELSVNLGLAETGQSAGKLTWRCSKPNAFMFSQWQVQPSLRQAKVTIRFTSDPDGRQFSTTNLQANLFNLASTNITVVCSNLVSGIPVRQISSVTIVPQFGDTNRVLVTETPFAGNPRTYLFIYTPQTDQWKLQAGGVRNDVVSHFWTTATNRTDTILINDGAGSNVTSCTESRVAFPWGIELVERVAGTGAAAQTSTWQFCTDPNSVNYSRLTNSVEPSGRWTSYSYDEFGRTTNTITQFANEISRAANLNRSTEVTFSDNIVCTVEKLLGTEISRIYQVTIWDGQDTSPVEQQTIRCATRGATLNDSTPKLTNTVWRAAVTGDFIKSKSEDGTMRFETVSIANDIRTVTSTSGVPDSQGAGIIDGTQTVTEYGMHGEILTETVSDIPSGIIIDQRTYEYTDDLKRSHWVHYLGGVSEYAGYSCCGLETTRDRQGVETDYLYDEINRQIGTVRNGIVTSNLLDSAGNILASYRVGSDGTRITNSISVFDDAGRVESQTNALGGPTLYSESRNPNGELVRLTVNPDNGEMIETFYLDGSRRSVTGSATHPVFYSYGVDDDGAYVQETKGVEDGSEWTRTYTDMLGRNWKSVYSAASGTPARISYFNSKGQLVRQVDPDGNSVLYDYNNRGEQLTTVIDMDGNATFNAGDRLTKTETDYLQPGGAFWGTDVVRRIRTWETNETGLLLVSEQLTSASGLRTATTSFGQTRSSETYFNPSLLERRTITTAADNSYTISTNIAGNNVSSALYAAGGGSPLQGTSYSYDPHGRIRQSIDLRDGATTLAYNAADLVVTNTTPDPDGAGPGAAQITRTLYDLSLRPYMVIQPDNTTVTTEYYQTGQQKKKYGSREYPVEFTYDYAGRMATMKTWRDYAGNSSATTTWHYNPYRGWLDSKEYPDGTGPSYTYYNSGRLHERNWARNNVKTTYTYNAAGQTTLVEYSDSTPDVSYTYDRRGRQLTASQGGLTATRVYSDSGQLQTETYSGTGPLVGLSVTNGFDHFLRRTNLVLNSGTSPLNWVSYGYQEASRLASVSEPANVNSEAPSAEYSYLANSSLVEQVAFKQAGNLRMTTPRSYDYLNRLTLIRSLNAQSVVIDSHTYAYNNANQRTRITKADSSRWDLSYDSLGQVTSGKRYWSDGVPVVGQQFEYLFDDIGNRKVTGAGGDQWGTGLRRAWYSANDLNQYVSRTVPGVVDVIGTAASTATVTVNNTPTYRHGTYYAAALALANTASPVYASITNLAVLNTTTNDVTTNVVGNVFVPQTPEQFYYDRDGNLTNDGRWIYTWDAENRLTSMVAKSAIAQPQRLDFGYDWQGRRITKKVWSNTTGTGTPVADLKFAYDGWNLIAELNATNNAVIRSYMWGLDLSGTLQGAGGVGGLLAIQDSASASTHFPAYDGNGNVSVLFSAASSSPTAQYEYGPFGEVVRKTGDLANANPFRFSSKYQDDETGLLYYTFRYYDTSAGRWISRDPLGEDGGPNLTAFSKNDAADRMDVLGLWEYFDLPYTRRSMDRARVWANEDRESYSKLAALLRLDPLEVKKWLRPWKPNSEVSKCDVFTVPNTVHVNRSVTFPFFWISYSLSEINVLSEEGYFVLYHVWPDNAEVISQFASADTYGIVSVAHGDPDNHGALETSSVMALQPGYIQPDLHHRLGGLKIIQCWADESSWWKVVSPTGYLYLGHGKVRLSDIWSIRRGFPDE